MGELVGVYIFGSVGRGDQDERSDLDVLAVVKNGAGKVEERYVLSFIPEGLSSLKPSISWYGQQRIAEMYQNGELFAWHLHRETIPLYEQFLFLKSIGQPSAYRDGAIDVHSFQKVLRGIPNQISANRYNAVYETGLIYVCIRNIAMAASWTFCERPNFSRYSPFKLEGVPACPITIEEYESTMSCRMASQRGIAPPEHGGAEHLIDMYHRLDPWVEHIRTRLNSEG